MKRYPREADPIDVLRTNISALEFYDSNARDISREAAVKTAIRLTAQFPTLVAAAERIRKGQEPVTPDPKSQTSQLTFSTCSRARSLPNMTPTCLIFR